MVLARHLARRVTAMRLAVTRWETGVMAALARMGARAADQPQPALALAAWTPPARSKAMRVLEIEQRIDAALERIEHLIRDGWIACRLASGRLARKATSAWRRAALYTQIGLHGRFARLRRGMSWATFWMSAAGGLAAAACADIAQAIGVNAQTRSRPVRAGVTPRQLTVLDWRSLMSVGAPGVARLTITPAQIVLTFAVQLAALATVASLAWALAVSDADSAALAAASLAVTGAIVAELALRIARARRVSAAMERFQREAVVAFVMRHDAPGPAARLAFNDAVSGLARVYGGGSRRAVWDAPFAGLFIVALGAVGGAPLAGFVAAIAAAFVIYSARAQTRGAPRAQLAQALSAHEAAARRATQVTALDDGQQLTRLAAIVRNAEWAVVFEADRRRSEAGLAFLVTILATVALAVLWPMSAAVDLAGVALCGVLAARAMAPIILASDIWRQREEVRALHQDMRRLHQAVYARSPQAAVHALRPRLETAA